ncbi:MAG: hypothetical protein Kow0069_05200 [Promethearchaeota archaeon]
MGPVKRAVKATIFSVFAYLIYVYLPRFLFQFAQDSYNFEIAQIYLGDVSLLQQYVLFFGFVIIGLTFAANMAVKKTRLHTTWEFARLFFGIVFWSMFIAARFDEIVVTATFAGIVLDLTLTITLLFYAMMGGKIFKLAILVLDLLIGYEPKEEGADRTAGAAA